MLDSRQGRSPYIVTATARPPVDTYSTEGNDDGASSHTLTSTTLLILTIWSCRGKVHTGSGGPKRLPIG